MTKLGDIVDLDGLAAAVEAGHVKAQRHPELPLVIRNYTNRCQFDRAWTPVTRQCRGLITDESGVVVARAFEKFFNYGEFEEGSLDLTAAAEVTNKLDGSLGILYPVPDGWAIATRGSFASEQAQHATQLLRGRYPDFTPPPGMTCLFEIIYPANRIVVNYGTTDDLVLLGAVDIETGRTVGPDWVSGWDGPMAEVFAYATLADALAAEPRDGQEGFVVYFPGTGERLKIKQDDYVILHRILTQTTARTVWEFLAVAACKHLIASPKHWGSRLGLDPARAAEILEVGDGWLDRLLDGVPDEFHAWLHGVIASLTDSVSALRHDTTAAIYGLVGLDRKSFAAAVAADPHKGILFLLYDGRDITANLWKAVYPDAGKPFTDQSEDVA